MIWKLLKKNVSIPQIVGYALANLVGLVIVLSAVRFYGDVSRAISVDTDTSDGSMAVMSPDYLVVSRPVSLFNTISGASSVFSDEDIEDIRLQPWCVDAGVFTSADFNVAASVQLGGQGVGTYLFLESIPDKFMDIKPKGWKFDAQKGVAAEIPIVISKDYLALYNFGFAGSRGLPQLSESLISDVPIVLKLTGNGHSDYMRAKIVGFSSRLNTIAVPEEFMEWANSRYSAGSQHEPSRVIVKVNSPGNPAIDTYFTDKGYEVAGDRVNSGKASYFLTVVTSIVVSVGAVISLLAFFILMLSIYLLLQKSREKISYLLLLGYTPMQVSMGYFKLIGVVNACVYILSVAAMLALSSIWESRLESLSIVAASPFVAIIVGMAIIIAITAINYLAIYRMVCRSFR